MKKIVFTLLLLFASCSLSFMMAQQQQRGKFNPEMYKAQLESYITDEAGFTPAEAQAFYPIYHEMKDKQRQLQRRIFWLKKNPPAANADDKDFAITIQKITDLNVEMAQLEVNYYKKMCSVVSPRKVYVAMQAEDRFHRNMLEEFGREKPRPKGQHKPN